LAVERHEEERAVVESSLERGDPEVDGADPTQKSGRALGARSREPKEPAPVVPGELRGRARDDALATIHEALERTKLRSRRGLGDVHLDGSDQERERVQRPLRSARKESALRHAL